MHVTYYGVVACCEKHQFGIQTWPKHQHGTCGAATSFPVEYARMLLRTLLVYIFHFVTDIPRKRAVYAICHETKLVSNYLPSQRGLHRIRRPRVYTAVRTYVNAQSDFYFAPVGKTCDDPPTPRTHLFFHERRGHHVHWCTYFMADALA